jgi:hypothetical protein
MLLINLDYFGVLVDNKLKFDTYVAQQCLAINRRLFNSKKLSFLPQEVRMTFFKAFILTTASHYFFNHLKYSYERTQKKGFCFGLLAPKSHEWKYSIM